MNPRPFLSILIPTRNRGKYVPFAVQSALNLEEHDIEILVSDNHSNDKTSELLSVFSDPRLKILRPDKPLPMHGNWEYLMSKAQGQWIYFLGNDDALMPHAVSHLKYIAQKYPQAEAVVSERAYYYWNKAAEKSVVSVRMSEGETWVDSKQSLDACLKGDIDYIYLPQLYSGGFQRRSLVNRIRRSQNGVYFRSVSPDAYSAAAACFHTIQFLKIGMPLAWVGSSPHATSNSAEPNAKDRRADFEGMHSEDDLVYCASLGTFNIITFTTVFFEAYVASLPCGDYRVLNKNTVRKLFVDTFVKLKHRVPLKELESLASQLCLTMPTIWDLGKYHARKYLLKYKNKLITKGRAVISENKASRARSAHFCSRDIYTYPNILSMDAKIREMYKGMRFEYF